VNPDDDQDIRLRDRFAIAAMQALLNQYKQLTSTTSNSNTYGSGTQGFSSSGTTNTNTLEFETETDQQYLARLEKKIEMISHLAYKIADQMRKARLATFL
jgi:hypothetical protein